jgi:four helix bundle protein
MSIASKEARESHYWLRLTRDGKVVAENELTQLMEEIEAIKRLLTSS